MVSLCRGILVILLVSGQVLAESGAVVENDLRRWMEPRLIDESVEPVTEWPR